MFMHARSLGLVLLCCGSAEAQLIISEVVDGTLPGGLPKFAELTNIGPDIPDLSIYSLGRFNNGSQLLGSNSVLLLPQALLSGESYVFAYEDPASMACAPAITCFEHVYGQPADQYDGAFINGDDVIALFLGAASGDAADAVLVDVFGVIGVDGSGEAWEYTDGFAQRCSEVDEPTSAMLPCQWAFYGANSLETGDDLTELPLIQNATSPFANDLACPGAPVTLGSPALWACTPAQFCTPKTSSMGCNATLTFVGPTSMPTAFANDWIAVSQNVQSFSNGIFFISASGAWTLPFQGGVLCLRPPLGRGPIQNAGGSGPCDGLMTLRVNNPANPIGMLGSPGTYLWIQSWYRDSGGMPFNSALSDAFMVQFQ